MCALVTGGHTCALPISVLLVITSPKLTALVFLVVPMVLLPILTYGRRVRRLSRASQDRVADLGVYAGEALDAIRTVQAFVHEAADRRHFSARRSEERRVGKECVSTCRSRGSADNKIKNIHITTS